MKDDFKTYVTFGLLHQHTIEGQRIDCSTVAVLHTEVAAHGIDWALNLFRDEFATAYPADRWVSEFPYKEVHLYE